MEGPLCNDPADEPEAHALCELAAHIHAATAEFSERVAAFDLRNAWGGAGIRSCAHWLSIYAGFDFPTGRGLIAVGAALGALPLTRAAFRTGELSLDKARALASVATAADEEGWVELGRELTAGQLSRICRLYRQARDGNPEAQLANRGLWTSYREDGMLPPGRAFAAGGGCAGGFGAGVDRSGAGAAAGSGGWRDAGRGAGSAPGAGSSGGPLGGAPG